MKPMGIKTLIYLALGACMPFLGTGCGFFPGIGPLSGGTDGAIRTSNNTDDDQGEAEDQDEPGDQDEVDDDEDDVEDQDGGEDDDDNEDVDGAVPDTVPDFEAATFTNPSQIDNPFLPQTPGTTRTYRAETEDGVEETIIDVLEETREVMGIACRVVRDRVFVDGLLVEDTHDWFAQDDDGNVWYMGEEVDNYDYDADGNVVNIDHGGAWEAGLDVAGVGVAARPGHVMKASPMPGDIYHQEYYPGEAEDMGEVLALEVTVTLGDGTMYTCLQTRDFNPLEPGVEEHKFYAPGIGVVVEEKVGGGERVELVSIEP